MLQCLYTLKLDSISTLQLIFLHTFKSIFFLDYFHIFRESMPKVLGEQDFHEKVTSQGVQGTAFQLQLMSMESKLLMLLQEHSIEPSLSLQWNILLSHMLDPMLKMKDVQWSSWTIVPSIILTGCLTSLEKKEEQWCFYRKFKLNRVVSLNP